MAGIIIREKSDNTVSDNKNADYIRTERYGNKEINVIKENEQRTDDQDKSKIDESYEKKSSYKKGELGDNNEKIQDNDKEAKTTSYKDINSENDPISSECRQEFPKEIEVDSQQKEFHFTLTGKESLGHLNKLVDDIYKKDNDAIIVFAFKDIIDVDLWKNKYDEWRCNRENRNQIQIKFSFTDGQDDKGRDGTYQITSYDNIRNASPNIDGTSMLKQKNDIMVKKMAFVMIEKENNNRDEKDRIDKTKLSHGQIMEFAKKFMDQFKDPDYFYQNFREIRDLESELSKYGQSLKKDFGITIPSWDTKDEHVTRYDKIFEQLREKLTSAKMSCQMNNNYKEINKYETQLYELEHIFEKYLGAVKYGDLAAYRFTGSIRPSDAPGRPEDHSKECDITYMKDFFETGASCIHTIDTFERSILKYQNIGRDNEGVFVTSYQEDDKLLDCASSREELASAKGLSPYIYEPIEHDEDKKHYRVKDTLLLQYVFSPELVKNMYDSNKDLFPKIEYEGANLSYFPGRTYSPDTSQHQKELVLPQISLQKTFENERNSETTDYNTWANNILDKLKRGEPVCLKHPWYQDSQGKFIQGKGDVTIKPIFLNKN